MTNIEYAELLNYINEQSNKYNNVSIYRVHSSYNPNTNKICKITLKINYTKDGSDLPNIVNGKLPKNVTERSVNFRSDNCNMEDIKEWLEDFMSEKANRIVVGGKYIGY